MMNSHRPRVAIISDSRRQDAIAQALYLLGDHWPAVPATGTILKPNLVSHTDLRASTHPITLGAVADFLYSKGAQELTIAEGASDATAGFRNLGHSRMFWKRPVNWFDVNKDENRWLNLELLGTNGTYRDTRLSQTLSESQLFVSVAQAKTHVNTMLTASMKNLMSCIHPQDRIHMHGYTSGSNGHKGFKGRIVNWLKGESSAVAWATTLIGRTKQIALFGQKLAGRLNWDSLSDSQKEFCKSIAVMHRNLVSLNQAVGPKLAIVDGFSGMDGEGPRLGRSRNFGWVVAGNDPVSVDSVVARLMGLPVDQIGYLVLAEQAGLGCLSLDRIEIVGDSLEDVSGRCRVHSHSPLQKFWKTSLDKVIMTSSTGLLAGPHQGGLLGHPLGIDGPSATCTSSG